MYKRGLCALCLLTTVGMSVSAQQIRTSYFMQSSTARTTMNPVYRPERGYVSIPVLGAVGASYGTNGIAVDNFIYPKNGETVTFMDNSVNTESFLNGLKDENQVNMDFGTQVLSGGWYAGKGFWTVDVSIKGLANIRAPKTLFEFMTFAWYGHLKLQEMKWIDNWPLFGVILFSWSIALFEYKNS